MHYLEIDTYFSSLETITQEHLDTIPPLDMQQFFLYLEDVLWLSGEEILELYGTAVATAADKFWEDRGVLDRIVEQ